ncbi:MAG: hypothetical protein V8S95_07820 [Odoribacter sp.]
MGIPDSFLKETFPGFDLLGEYGLEEQEDFMDVAQRGHVLSDMEEKTITYWLLIIKMNNIWNGLTK